MGGLIAMSNLCQTTSRLLGIKKNDKERTHLLSVLFIVSDTFTGENTH